MRLRLLGAFALAGALGGCVTTAPETHVEVSFASEPDAAEVRIPSGRTCLTPCRLFVERGEAVPIVISKPGFQPAQVSAELSRGQPEAISVVLAPEGLPQPAARGRRQPAPAAAQADPQQPSPEDVEAARQLFENPAQSQPVAPGSAVPERLPTPREVMAPGRRLIP